MGYEQGAEFISRAVMYGVDKIPDSWFDKVPGGFYKPNQKNVKKDQEGQKFEGGESGKKQRRYSHHHDDRRRGRRDRYDDEYRSDDNRRQERRGRSSYDGNHDDDRYERRDAKEGGRRHRCHSVDSERYGHDGPTRAAPNAYYGDRKVNSSKPARPPDGYFDDRQRPVTNDSNRSATTAHSKAAAAVGTGFATTAAAEAGAPYPQTRSNSVHSANMPSPHVQTAQSRPSTTTERPRYGSTTNRYVPYAHLYGQIDNHPATQPTFAPPPTSSFSSIPPGTAPPGSRPSSTHPKGHQQSPAAQQAPTAADTGAGASYNGQTGISPQAAWPPNSARAFAGYENTPPYPESPPPGRSTDKYSPSYASGGRRDSDVRRTRSERRPDASSKGERYKGELLSLSVRDKRGAYLPAAKDTYVDPRAPLNGQVNIPPPPPGPPVQSSPPLNDERRDSAQENERRRSSYRHNDRGYTSD